MLQVSSLVFLALSFVSTHTGFPFGWPGTFSAHSGALLPSPLSHFGRAPRAFCGLAGPLAKKRPRGRAPCLLLRASPAVRSYGFRACVPRSSSLQSLAGRESVPVHNPSLTGRHGAKRSPSLLHIPVLVLSKPGTFFASTTWLLGQRCVCPLDLSCFLCFPILRCVGHAWPRSATAPLPRPLAWLCPRVARPLRRYFVAQRAAVGGCRPVRACRARAVALQEEGGAVVALCQLVFLGSLGLAGWHKQRRVARGGAVSASEADRQAPFALTLPPLVQTGTECA
ncbi:hypothetical protein TRVL_06734 [Trypanosoma vivax]|nr:hypothetical protein TRVL_06734 [Trypanosoma vivax]